MLKIPNPYNGCNLNIFIINYSLLNTRDFFGIMKLVDSRKKAEIHKVVLTEKMMIAIKDKSYLNKEVYLINFKSKKNYISRTTCLYCFYGLALSLPTFEIPSLNHGFSYYEVQTDGQIRQLVKVSSKIGIIILP